MTKRLSLFELAAVLLLMALLWVLGCTALMRTSAQSSAEDAKAAADCAEKNARGTDAAKNARAAADRAGRAAIEALGMPGAGSSDVDADPRVRAAAADLADAQAAAKRAADAQHRAELAASIADYDLKTATEEYTRAREAYPMAKANADYWASVAKDDKAALEAADARYRAVEATDPDAIKQGAADAKKEADARVAVVSDAEAKLAQVRLEAAADIANAAADEAGRAAEAIAKCRDVVQKSRPGDAFRVGQDLFGSQGGRRVPGPGGSGGAAGPSS